MIPLLQSEINIICRQKKRGGGGKEPPFLAFFLKFYLFLNEKKVFIMLVIKVFIISFF